MIYKQLKATNTRDLIVSSLASSSVNQECKKSDGEYLPASTDAKCSGAVLGHPGSSWQSVVSTATVPNMSSKPPFAVAGRSVRDEHNSISKNLYSIQISHNL